MKTNYDSPLQLILTNRELQVFKLIVSGLKTKEISLILELKPNTISTMKKNIKIKLKEDSEIGFYKIAIQNNVTF